MLCIFYTDHKIMCRKTLGIRLRARYVDAKNNLIANLLQVESVCTPADCWSARGKSYLGVTCHWLDRVTLHRKSVSVYRPDIWETQLRFVGKTFRRNPRRIWVTG